MQRAASHRKPTGRTAAAACALGAVVALLVLTPSASADFTLCASGAGAGQCTGPQGVAVDFETGRVYVADKGNHRVDVYEANGTPVSSFSGALGSPSWIAVDNGAASPSHHDVYVVDGHQVRKFTPAGVEITGGSLPFGSAGSGAGQFEDIRGIGVSAAGVVFVGDIKELGACKVPELGGTEFTKRVQKFEGNGTLVGASQASDAPCGRVSAFAVDSEGHFYLYNQGGSEALRKYEASEPTATLLTIKEANVAEQTLAVDSANDLFAVQAEARKKPALGSIRVVARLSPGGSVLRRYGYGALETNAIGLAANHSASADAYASEEAGKAKALAEPPGGPVIVPASVEAAPIGNASATLNAEVNPEGKAAAYHFEYLTQEQYETEGGWASPKKKSTAPTSVGAPDFSLHYVNALAGCAEATKAKIEAEECLFPETAYRFRVKASNPDGEGSGPLEGTFATREALEIGPAWATEVGTDTARLHAEVNPLGIPAGGYFEVVDDAHFKASGFAEATDVPDVAHGQAPISFGSGQGFSAKSALLSPLPAGTTFHYRILATDGLIEPAEFEGEAHAFTTFKATAYPACENDSFRIGLGAFLPDCRAYEMVSPLDKESGDIKPLGEGTTDLPATLDQSATSGEKLAYGTYRAFGDTQSAPFTSQYIAARGTGGWASHAIGLPQGRPLGVAAKRVDTELKALSADLCEGWLRTTTEPPLEEAAPAGQFNLYRRADEECGGPSYEAITRTPIARGFATLELQGKTTDGSAAIYAVNDSLAVEGPQPPVQPGGCVSPETGIGCNPELYYRRASGALHFVCVLPSGSPIASGGCVAGTNAGDEGQGRRNSLREAISADGSKVFWSTVGAPSSQLYLRENPDSPQGSCGEAERACTLAVSKEAEEASGSSGAQFWGAAVDGSRAIFATGGNLYEFDSGEAKDHLIAHKAVGVAGMSADAGWVYFASEEALSGPNPQGKAPVAGKPNLYLAHAGSIHFVATLVGEDVNSIFSVTGSQPRFNSSHVSADGHHLAFMSQASPTGYDNLDASNNGKAAGEVYLYDAGAEAGEGRLLCASCNPSGARPVGSKIGAHNGSYWAAAELPIWENTLYQPRALAAGGNRLFFSAGDALTPRDTNGVGDVYEWQAVGSGGCTGTEAPGYSALNEGCLNLISSGQSPRTAEFVDADPSGHDAFFATLASLLPQDYGLLDVYDAREAGGFPVPPAPAPECEAEACRHPAPAPAFQAPGSLGFQGAGNVTEEAKKSPHKHHRKKRRKHRRASGRVGR